MNETPIRAYSKQELAQTYFPDIAPRSAVNRLRAWIDRCQPLARRSTRRDTARPPNGSRPTRSASSSTTSATRKTTAERLLRLARKVYRHHVEMKER